MRWPDLFFKKRTPRPTPEIVTVPAKSPEGDAGKSAAPAKTETLKVGAAQSERDKTESLRALADVDVDRPVGDKGAPASDPDATRQIEGSRAAETDSSNAKTAALPPFSKAPTLSLRQRAKLTDDARSLPKQDDEPTTAFAKADTEPLPAVPIKPSDEAEKTESPAAVVPAAFTVSVETGTVLDTPAPKSSASSAGPLFENPPTGETSPTPETSGPSAPTADQPAAHAPTTPSSDTARVHLAHTTTTAEPATTLEPVKPAADTREKQEFILANGERILGHVLSETPQTIYLDHGTLGVLTLPRAQVAAKPIEVILINGDRIVGDLIAETPECLYIKHASLGMLTVPHGQRSTRVVEAILKDGDRILGEVLAETENFTVIRSATLGTVAVQHEQVAMLNRKIEQMQLRTLPPAAPALENKKD